jgi:hypothetical protein
VQVRPNLQVDDAVKSAVVVLWIDWPAVIDHREKAVIFWKAFKHHIMSLTREMLRDWQATSDVSEPQMVNN